MEPVYNPGDILQRNPELLSSKIDNETIMMSMLDGNYYGLNEVAGRIWEILEKPHTFSELIATLLNEFDVDEATCSRDVSGFLKKLEDKKLIIINRNV